MASNDMVGSVASLWRYPVKSMMGEELRSTDITKGGVLGDRAFALIDTETNKETLKGATTRDCPYNID